MASSALKRAREAAEEYKKKQPKIDWKATPPGTPVLVPADPTMKTSDRFKIMDDTVKIIKRKVFDELLKKMLEILNRPEVPHALYFQGPIGMRFFSFFFFSHVASFFELGF